MRPMTARNGFWRRRPADRGVALILAMLVLTLLIIVVFQLSYTTKVDLRLAKNRLDLSVLDYACDGVYARAKAYLEADARENEWDGPGDLWENADFAADAGMEDYDYASDPWGEEDADEESRIELDVYIIDEERKLNLSLLAEPTEQDRREERAEERRRSRENRQSGDSGRDDGARGEAPRNRAEEKRRREMLFEALISILVEYRDGTAYDLSGTEARRIADDVRDYVNRKAAEETGDGTIPRPDTIDAPALTVDELLMLPSITEDLLFDFLDPDDEEIVVPGLLNFVTIWSSGRVNLNTAPPVVLRSLFEDDRRDEVDRILEYREEAEQFQDEEEEEEGIGSDRDRDPDEEETIPGVFREVGELQSNNLIDNEDYQRILPFVTTRSTVFSVYVTAERGKVVRRTRAVLRRVDGRVYPLLFEIRKDELLYGRDLEAEEDEGGGFLF